MLVKWLLLDSWLRLKAALPQWLRCFPINLPLRRTAEIVNF